MKLQSKVAFIKQYLFLKDILFVAVAAFGGPQAHFAMIHRKLVQQKNYLTEAELLELNALCQMLPGPTSTQTLTCIGYKLGGPVLAAFTLLVWILPATLIMTLIALSFNFFDKREISINHYLRFLQPMAVGFIVVAAIKLCRVTARNALSSIIILGSTLAAVLVASPILFPLIIIAGAAASYLNNRKAIVQPTPIIVIRWRPLVVFAIIFVAIGSLALLTRYKPVVLFENNYRFGSLVFGGGNVLIPMMYEQFVQFKRTIAISNSDFMTGVGLVQAVPGPVFSFATYVSAMGMRPDGWVMQIVGAIVGTLGIFLPGLLIIFFVYPLWDQFKNHPVIRKSLEGINATAAGLVASAAILLFMQVDFQATNMLIIGITVLILQFTRIPAPLLVIFSIILGVVI